MKGIFQFSFSVICLVCAVTVYSQTSVRSDEASAVVYGRIENNIYINEVFGFRLNIPVEGAVLNRAQTEVFRNAGADYLKGDNKELSKKLDNELQRQITIFNYVSRPLGSADNSSLVIAVAKQPVGATSNLVLAETLKELAATGKFELVEALKGIKVGGADFAGIVGKMSVSSLTVNVKFLVAMRNGYSFCISSNYQSEAGEKKITDVLNSLQFQNR
jgi:hypothetical protein